MARWRSHSQGWRGWCLWHHSHHPLCHPVMLTITQKEGGFRASLAEGDGFLFPALTVHFGELPSRRVLMPARGSTGFRRSLQVKRSWKSGISSLGNFLHECNSWLHSQLPFKWLSNSYLGKLDQHSKSYNAPRDLVFNFALIKPFRIKGLPTRGVQIDF